MFLVVQSSERSSQHGLESHHCLGKIKIVNIRPYYDLTKKQQEHDKDLREHVKLFREEYKDQEIKIKGEKL